MLDHVECHAHCSRSQTVTHFITNNSCAVKRIAAQLKQLLHSLNNSCTVDQGRSTALTLLIIHAALCLDNSHIVHKIGISHHYVQDKTHFRSKGCATEMSLIYCMHEKNVSLPEKGCQSPVHCKAGD